LNQIILLLAFASFSVFFIWCVSRFYRNPERDPSGRKDVIVSPADGRIARIQRYAKDAIPSTVKDGRRIGFDEIVKAGLTWKDYYLVAIVMSPFDVHFNRAPISGQVGFLQKIPGRFVTMRQPVFEYVNERVTVAFENELLNVGVVQIAAPIASSIKSFVSAGQQVQIGQRYGAILLGSQVDVIIPARVLKRMLVGLGSRVKAGETIIAEIRDCRDKTGGTDSPSLAVTEGSLDLQSRGFSRFLQFFYLGSLLVASILLKLSTGMRRRKS